MEDLIILLNKILDIDREGVSRAVFSEHLVDITISHTPINLEYRNSPTHAALNMLGLINGIVAMQTAGEYHVIAIMRNTVMVEKFELALMHVEAFQPTQDEAE